MPTSMNDTAMHNPGAGHWSAVVPAGDPPTSRCCCSVIHHEDHLYVFGGGTVGTFQNELHRFCLTSREWAHLQYEGPFGQRLRPRLSHAATAYKGSMIVFGGLSVDMCLDETLFLDFATLKWRQVDSQASPSPRKGHAAVRVGSKMYVLLGADVAGRVFSDVWCADLDADDFQWKRVEVRGDAPLGAEGLSAVQHNDHILTFGGRASTAYAPPQWLNTVHSLNTANNTWTAVEVSGPLRPPGRYGHISWLCGGRLFVHGGDSTNFQTYYDDVWSVPATGGTWVKETFKNTPSARSGHCAVLVDGCLYSFGGEVCNTHDPRDTEYYDTMLLLPHCFACTATLRTLASRWLRLEYGTAPAGDDIALLPSHLITLLQDAR